MKAFSKHGKVSINIYLIIRVVYAKCLVCKEDQVYLLMAANSVVAMVATL
jgi:hypothetical protein